MKSLVICWIFIPEFERTQFRAAAHLRSHSCGVSQVGMVELNSDLNASRSMGLGNVHPNIKKIPPSITKVRIGLVRFDWIRPMHHNGLVKRDFRLSRQGRTSQALQFR